jgi:hypothetical protein
MSTQEFSSKWALGLIIAILFMVAGALVALEVEVPFETRWTSSGHADPCSEAFRHWDEDGEVSTRCAKCHSTPGFMDFIGADGSSPGEVNEPAALGTTIECVACHNDAATVMDSVTFPSGVEVTGLGDEARCMQCHQGRESSVSVNQRIDDSNAVDDDSVSSDLSFRNIHYYAAGATQFGSMTMGGYQYEGKTYDAKFAHIEELDTCDSCHEPHSLEIDVDTCAVCHDNVVTHEDLKDIRFYGSSSDYDGDGDEDEGIFDEIADLKDILYSAIQSYASGTVGVPIVYDSHSHPYWFNGTGGRYSDWTPRLLRATYNYQFSMKDPGGFAHGGKYVIQLLYDSIEDLDAVLGAGLTVNLHRDDPGHFAGSKEAFRHWDEDGEVSGRCSKCHSASGLPFYLEEGVTASQPIANGLMCSTCHDAIPEFTRHEVEEVEFPSGAVLDTGDPNSNLCISCHQGRESTVSVNESIAGKDLDTPSSSVRFRNSHYYPAGATLFGTEAKGAYVYAGKLYNGRSRHLQVPSVDSCHECHDSHKLEVRTQETCIFCHNVVDGPRDIRRDTTTDFDGDGSSTEPLVEEIETLQEKLYAAIQSYAANVCMVPIKYDSHSYPYWFKDDGSGDRYNAFTPRLLMAAYNYQFIKKDPGGFAHNGHYIIQLLYDGIADLGTKVAVDMTGLVRPAVANTSAECGDATHPYPVGDLNHDCRVNFEDIALLGSNWLEDINPQLP